MAVVGSKGGVGGGLDSFFFGAGGCALVSMVVAVDVVGNEDARGALDAIDDDSLGMAAMATGGAEIGMGLNPCVRFGGLRLRTGGMEGRPADAGVVDDRSRLGPGSMEFNLDWVGMLDAWLGGEVRVGERESLDRLMAMLTWSKVSPASTAGVVGGPSVTRWIPLTSWDELRRVGTGDANGEALLDDSWDMGLTGMSGKGSTLG